MENRVKEIMSSVLQIEINEINKDTSPTTLDTWDSLNHMSLVVALEEEFSVSFNSEEIMDMTNYTLIVNTVEIKL